MNGSESRMVGMVRIDVGLKDPAMLATLALE